MTEWKHYTKTATQEMRPYIPGEDLTGISVSEQDTPELGGMIARNASNYKDQWYVAKDFFEKNYQKMPEKYSPALRYAKSIDMYVPEEWF